MGIGVVRDVSSHVISVYPGAGTNQVAELLALRVAIEVANPGDRIFSDSQYAINISLSRWQAKMHLEIVRDIKIALSLKRVSIEWMPRCSHPLHALADRWANFAAETRRPVIVPQADLIGVWATSVAAEAMRSPACDEVPPGEAKLTDGLSPVETKGTCKSKVSTAETQGVIARDGESLQLDKIRRNPLR